MSLSLLTLPEEVLVSVLSCLPPVSLVRVSQVHPLLNQLVKEESIWVERAKQDYGIDLKTSEGFSPREFYQAVLYKLGPLLGVWQRTDLKHYSGLVKLSYQNQEVILEAILPPRTVNEDIKKETLLTFKSKKQKKDEDIDLTRCFLYKLQPGRISIKILNETQSSLHHQPHPSRSDDGDNQLNLFSRLSEFFTNGTEEMINVGELECILRIENKGGDAIDSFEEFLNEQPYGASYGDLFGMELFRRKKEEIFCWNLSCSYKRFEEATHPIASLPSGLFAGLHGVEFINVGLVETESSPGERNIRLLGRKVTADVIVPCDKVIFEVVDPRCLNMSLEEQETTQNIRRFMEEPRFIEYQEGLSLPFKVPEDFDDAQYLPPGLTHCRGRWSCTCHFPIMTPGNLIVFSEDLFAVITPGFLSFQSMSVYKKVPRF